MPNIIFAKCPKCGKEAKNKDQVDKLFGWRKVDGRSYPQSYCKEHR